MPDAVDIRMQRQAFRPRWQSNGDDDDDDDDGGDDAGDDEGRRSR